MELKLRPTLVFVEKSAKRGRVIKKYMKDQPLKYHFSTGHNEHVFRCWMNFYLTVVGFLNKSITISSSILILSLFLFFFLFHILLLLFTSYCVPNFLLILARFLIFFFRDSYFANDESIRKGTEYFQRQRKKKEKERGKVKGKHRDLRECYFIVSRYFTRL